MNSANTRCRLIGVLTLVISGTWMAAAWAQQPVFNIMKPSTTGVPGEEVRLMEFDPAGNLWVGARWLFWGEGGLAMLSADQLQYDPLPGGGFDTGAWKVWSNVHYPIPSVYLNNIKFGADGTIWLASDGGLTRFRPNAAPADMWFTYTPANSPLLISEVRSLAIDSQGNLWISNASPNGGGGLFRFDPATDQWTRINIGQNPWEVTVGNNDHIFVSMTTSGGMMEFDGNSWVMRGGAPQLEGMLQDSQGNVWAATGDSGLWKWNGSSWRNWGILGGDVTITGLGKDRDGVVYVSCWLGPVYKMVNDDPVFFANADNIPRSVFGRPNGEVWISNYGGNGTLGTVRHYTAGGQLLERINTYNSGLPDYFIERIKRDSAGNMWFASGEGGLSRMLGSNGASDAATHWRNWGNHNDLSEPYPWAGNEPMYSVFEDANGIFWMGGNGIGRWDSNTGQFTGFWNWQNSAIDSSGMYALTKRGGTMWAGSGGSGVFWFDGASWNHVTLTPGGYSYSPNNVKAMTVDTQDNLWVASEYGLRKFAPGNNSTFTQYDPSNTPMTSGGMLDVEADPNGGVWAATYEGLARFDGATWTIYNQANTGMPGPVVSDVARRPSDGMIAIANYQGSTWPYTGGVSTFDGTAWIHYTPDNSPLTHWQVIAVEFDGNGNLWASADSEGAVQILIGVGASPTPTPNPTPTPVSTPTPTPGGTPTPTATPTSAPVTTPTPTPTSTPTVSPTPITRAINLSTRMLVQTGDNVGIGGFIITGSAPKHVLLRAMGPSLTGSGVPNVLADPMLELHGPGTFFTVTNDNWRQTQEAEIVATGIPPADDRESAIMATLTPGAYTAIVKGNGSTSGVALVEVYDLDQGVDSKLANLSTRALVSTDTNIVIAGFMLGGNPPQAGSDRIVVRGIGPSLTAAGLPDALADPVLELRDTNGTLLTSNNDWQDNAAQAAELTAAGLAPVDNLEAAIAATLPPGLYTALLAGLNNGAGIGAVEVYDRGGTP